MITAPGAQPMFVESAATRASSGRAWAACTLADAQMVFCGERLGEHDPAAGAHARLACASDAFEDLRAGSSGWLRAAGR